MKPQVLILCASVLAACASKPAESPNDVVGSTSPRASDDSSMNSHSSSSGMTPSSNGTSSASGTTSSSNSTSSTMGGSTNAGSSTGNGTSAGKGMTGNGTGSGTSTSDGRTMPPDGATGSATSGAMQPDNTGVNKRDASGAPLTAGDQSNAKSDVDITAEIRRSIVGDSAMSMTAKNVKIITVKGKVTLRGPVKTAEERSKIEAAAKRVAGDAQVDNQLEVKTK